MAPLLYLTVRKVPAPEQIADLRGQLVRAFPHKENSVYLDALCGSPLPRVTAERLGALSLLPPLLETAGVDTADLILRRNENGRPYCAREDGSPVGFDFNLSHSAAHVACALLIGNCRVGLDVEEPIPPKRALSLLKRYGTKWELTLLGTPPAEDSPTAIFFTSLWTSREALAKQAGTGMPLQFDCSAVPAELQLLQGTLPDTEASIALCAPVGVNICLAKDSLPIRFSMENSPR